MMYVDQDIFDQLLTTEGIQLSNDTSQEVKSITDQLLKIKEENTRQPLPTQAEIFGGLALTDEIDISQAQNNLADFQKLKNIYPTALTGPFHYHTQDIKYLNDVVANNGITPGPDFTQVFFTKDKIGSDGKVVPGNLDESTTKAILRPGQVRYVTDGSIETLDGYQPGDYSSFPTISKLPKNSIKAILVLPEDRANVEQQLKQLGWDIPVVSAEAWTSFAYVNTDSSTAQFPKPTQIILQNTPKSETKTNDSIFSRIQNFFKNIFAKKATTVISNPLAPSQTLGQNLANSVINTLNTNQTSVIRNTNVSSNIPLKQVTLDGKTFLIPQDETVENMIQFVDEILGSKYQEKMRLPGCRSNLCAKSANLLQVVSDVSKNWEVRRYEIRDVNTFRGVKEEDSFSGHAFSVLINKTTGEKYLVDLTFSQFIDPDTNLISFNNLSGENSINSPILQQAIEEKIARGEKVKVNTNIDYNQNPIAQELLQKGYLPFSKLTEYLNLTVDQKSVADAQDVLHPAFWDQYFDEFSSENPTTTEKQLAVEDINSVVLPEPVLDYSNIVETRTVGQQFTDWFFGRTLGVIYAPQLAALISSKEPVKLKVIDSDLMPIDTVLSSNTVDHISNPKDRQSLADWATKHLNYTNQNERFFKDSNPVVVELQQKLNELVDVINTERLLKKQKPIPYTKLYISVNGAPNAYSIPDGSIVISQSLINLMNTKDEVVAILTHELSHFEDNFLNWREGISNTGSKQEVSGALVGRLQEYKADYVGMRLKKIGMNGQAMTSALENLVLNNKESIPSIRTRITDYLVKIFKIDTGLYFEIVADVDHGSTANRTGGQELANKMVEAGGRAIAAVEIPTSWKREVSNTTTYGEFVQTLNSPSWKNELLSLPPALFEKYTHEFGGAMSRNLSNHTSFYRNHDRYKGSLFFGLPQYFYDLSFYIKYAKSDISDLHKFEIITDIYQQKSGVSANDRDNLQRLLLTFEEAPYTHLTPLETILSTLKKGLIPNVRFVGDPKTAGEKLFANIKLDHTNLTTEFITKITDDSYWKNIFDEAGLNFTEDYNPSRIVQSMIQNTMWSSDELESRFGENNDSTELAHIHHLGRLADFLISLPESKYYSKDIESYVESIFGYMMRDLYRMNNDYANRDYDEERLKLILQYHQVIKTHFPKMDDEWLYYKLTSEQDTKYFKLDTRIRVKKYLIVNLNLNIDLSFEDEFYAALFGQDSKLFAQLLHDYPDNVRDYFYKSWEDGQNISGEQRNWMYDQVMLFINSPEFKTAKWTLDYKNRWGEDQQFTSQEKEFQFEYYLSQKQYLKKPEQIKLAAQIQNKYYSYLQTLSIESLLLIAHWPVHQGIGQYEDFYANFANEVFASPAVVIAQSKLIAQTSSLTGLEGSREAYILAKDFLVRLADGSSGYISDFQRDRIPFFGRMNQEATFLKPYAEKLITNIEQSRPSDFPATESTSLDYFYAIKSLPESDQKNRLIDYVSTEMIKKMPFGGVLDFVYRESKNGDSPEFAIKLFENRIQTYDEYQQTIKKFGDNFFQDMTTKATFKSNTGVLLDTVFTNLLNSSDAYDFFVAAMTGDDAKLRYFIGSKYYEMVKGSGSAKVGVWLNEETFALEGPAAADFITMDELMKKMYSLSKTQKTILLYKLLAEDKNGLLNNRALHPKIADLVMGSIEDDKSTKSFLKNVILAVLGQDRGRTKIALGVSSSLSDVFLQHKVDASNKYAAQEIVKKKRQEEDDQDRRSGHSSPSKETRQTNKLEDQKLAVNIERLFDQSRSDIMNDPTNNHPDVLSMRASLENLYSSTFTGFGQPVTVSPALVSESQKVPSAKFIVEVGKALGSLGVRFLQVMGQYFDIGPDMQKDFQQVYDSASPLFMGNAFQTTDKAIETMQDEITALESGKTKMASDDDTKLRIESLKKEVTNMTNYRDNMFVVRKIGGGSVNTAYIVTKKLVDGSASKNLSDREIYKILNPNTQETLIKDTVLVKDVIATLKLTDKKKIGDYLMAERLITTLEQWINEDVSDTKYLSYDPIFTSFYDGYVAPNGTNISYSETRSPYNEWVKVEGFVDGDTLKAVIANITSDNPESIKNIDTPEARKAKMAVEDFISDYVRHLFTPVTLPDGRVVRMLHSDLHSGNVMMSNDLNSGYVIDRSYYLILEDQDVVLIDKVFYEKNTDIQKLDSMIKYFLSENNISTGLKYYSAYSKLFIAAAKHQGDTDGVINALMQEMDKLDLTVPIRMRLFVKNMSAINRMLSYSSNKTLPDFISDFHQAEKNKSDYSNFIRQIIIDAGLDIENPVAKIFTGNYNDAFDQIIKSIDTETSSPDISAIQLPKPTQTQPADISYLPVLHTDRANKDLFKFFISVTLAPQSSEKDLTMQIANIFPHAITYDVRTKKVYIELSSAFSNQEYATKGASINGKKIIMPPAGQADINELNPGDILTFPSLDGKTVTIHYYGTETTHMSDGTSIVIPKLSLESTTPTTDLKDNIKTFSPPTGWIPPIQKFELSPNNTQSFTLDEKGTLPLSMRQLPSPIAISSPIKKGGATSSISEYDYLSRGDTQFLKIAGNEEYKNYVKESKNFMKEIIARLQSEQDPRIAQIYSIGYFQNSIFYPLSTLTELSEVANAPGDRRIAMIMENLKKDEYISLDRINGNLTFFNLLVQKGLDTIEEYNQYVRNLAIYFKAVESNLQLNQKLLKNGVIKTDKPANPMDLLIRKSDLEQGILTLRTYDYGVIDISQEVAQTYKRFGITFEDKPRENMADDAVAALGAETQNSNDGLLSNYFGGRDDLFQKNINPDTWSKLPTFLGEYLTWLALQQREYIRQLKAQNGYTPIISFDEALTLVAKYEQQLLLPNSYTAFDYQKSEAFQQYLKLRFPNEFNQSRQPLPTQALAPPSTKQIFPENIIQKPNLLLGLLNLIKFIPPQAHLKLTSPFLSVLVSQHVDKKISRVVLKII